MWAWRQYARRCQPGGVLVDCGANVGDVSMMLLRKNFTVHAFEPDPVAINVLKARFQRRPLFNLYEAAVGARSRQAVLYRADNASVGETIHSSIFETATARTDRAIEVPVVDLFSFIDALDRPVNVLKLDVEGAEFEILERMVELDAWREIDHVFVESHAGFKPEFMAQETSLRARLKSLGRTNVHFGWV